jgi:hypothetical protein
MILNIMIDTYERHLFARSVSRSKVKVICVLVAKLKKIHIKSPVQSLLIILKIIIDIYERHRFARSVSRSRSKVKVVLKLC